ncbi:MAG: hypothetical protein KH431_09905 [Erysipelotrichaceae bacterium]|nr:hypothetical protein [Erysipelotrichaceae bacterium]
MKLFKRKEKKQKKDERYIEVRSGEKNIRKYPRDMMLMDRVKRERSEENESEN